MDKLKMQTANKADENFKKLAAMFPNAVTETIDENGEVVRAIDKDVLMQEISCKVVEGNEERYQFTWPDKKKSVLLANAPINKTLRPCREESVDFDNTENLYIEGDNLEVLKLLQETYLGKIKMIYIDPPYNTGNDFVYEDDYSMHNAEFIMHNGGYDEDGNRLFKNMDTNGRFHTDWLNMIYPRLKLAKDLMSDDGVIFISIDDNEQENIKKLCDEIFGSQNFISQIIWERAYAPVNLKKHFSECHDYIICYSKNIENAICNGLPRTAESDNRYLNPDNDPRGVWQSDNATVGPAIPTKVYELTTPNGRKIFPPSGRCWLYTKERFQEMIDDNRIWFGADGNNAPRVKRFLSEVKGGLTPMTIWKYTEVGHSQEAAQKLKKLFDGKAFFDYPKSVELIKRCIQLYSDKDCYVLDFFSGSATTAHAVMQLNAEDGGNRKFIMVQLPEKTDEKSEAYKAGYKNICEIGKERIRRAGAKCRERLLLEGQELRDISSKKNQGEIFAVSNAYWIDSPKYKSDNEKLAYELDIGFRVLKLDSSNMKDVYYTPAEYEPSLFSRLEDNIKEDRTPEDLLFQVMLDLGILLSSKITMHNAQCIIHNEKRTYSYFDVADGYLIACFDNNITEEIITAIAKQKPYYFVMRDSSMANDSVATNFEQIFAAYSPETTRKVL